MSTPVRASGIEPLTPTMSRWALVRLKSLILMGVRTAVCFAALTYLHRFVGVLEIEPVGVHHFAPRHHKVLCELLLRILAAVDLRKCAQLRMRAEDEIDSRAGPFHFLGFTVFTLIHALGTRGLPLGAHIEKVHEELIGQLLRPLGKDTVLGLPGV